MPGDMLSVIATGTDVSLRLVDLVKARSKGRSLREAFGKVRPILAKLEDPRDPLVGYWRLKYWNFKSVHLPPYQVSGGLAIHLRDEHQSWIGRMCLEYSLGPYPNGQAIRAFPPPFIATYDIAFHADSNMVFSGACHMIEKVDLVAAPLRWFWAVRYPRANNYKWRGEFQRCRLDGVGATRALSGAYRNHPIKNDSAHAEFAFHLPVRWSEIDIESFVY